MENVTGYGWLRWRYLAIHDVWYVSSTPLSRNFGIRDREWTIPNDPRSTGGFLKGIVEANRRLWE